MAAGAPRIAHRSRARAARRLTCVSALPRARPGRIPTSPPTFANLATPSLRGPGSRLVLRNRAPALTAAAHGNETAALSLFEQPFCSGVQGAKVTLLRVRALRRIAKSSGPTAGGQRIDRTGDPVAAKYNEERAGADTGGLSARRVVLGTLQEVTVRHQVACRQLSLGRRPLGDLSYPLCRPRARLRPGQASLPEASRELREVSALVGLITRPPENWEKGETDC